MRGGGGLELLVYFMSMPHGWGRKNRAPELRSTRKPKTLSWWCWARFSSVERRTFDFEGEGMGVGESNLGRGGGGGGGGGGGTLRFFGGRSAFQCLRVLKLQGLNFRFLDGNLPCRWIYT